MLGNGGDESWKHLAASKLVSKGPTILALLVNDRAA